MSGDHCANCANCAGEKMRLRAALTKAEKQHTKRGWADAQILREIAHAKDEIATCEHLRASERAS